MADIAPRRPYGNPGMLGQKRALLGSRDRFLRLWDPDAGRELCRLEGHTDAVFSVDVSVDGRFGLSGSADGTVRLWRLPDP